MSSIGEHASLLKLLHKSNPKFRKVLLRNRCDDSFVRCISNCCHNILNGNVPLNANQLKKLKAVKGSIRKIAAKKTSIKTKKTLIQRGGFLGALLPAIIPAIGGLLGNLFSGNK